MLPIRPDTFESLPDNGVFLITAISRLISQLESELFVRTHVLGVNLAACAFNCISKQMLIIKANTWRLIDALTDANYSF